MPLYELDGRRVTVPASGRFWVAGTAVLVGDVTIEEDASVWFGAVARGDNEPIVIGPRANVQDGCILHTDPGFPLTIGAEATIGQAVADILRPLQIEVSRSLVIRAIAVNHELGARIGLHRRNHAPQDILASVVNARVVSPEAGALTDLAGQRFRRRRRRRHSGADASRAAC